MSTSIRLSIPVAWLMIGCLPALAFGPDDCAFPDGMQGITPEQMSQLQEIGTSYQDQALPLQRQLEQVRQDEGWNSDNARQLRYRLDVLQRQEYSRMRALLSPEQVEMLRRLDPEHPMLNDEPLPTAPEPSTTPPDDHGERGGPPGDEGDPEQHPDWGGGPPEPGRW